jgi:hypothetical protein
LASLPPDVDVPLPLRLDFIELPVVGDVPGVAELAAGSPEVEPRPLGNLNRNMMPMDQIMQMQRQGSYSLMRLLVQAKR